MNTTNLTGQWDDQNDSLIQFENLSKNIILAVEGRHEDSFRGLQMKPTKTKKEIRTILEGLNSWIF
jgi:hypothetical protein